MKRSFSEPLTENNGGRESSQDDSFIRGFPDSCERESSIDGV